MIPKGIATPRFKTPHMNFKKEILVAFRKILVPFITTKDRSLLLVWQICSLGSIGSNLVFIIPFGIT
jgi:hypothetical protein